MLYSVFVGHLLPSVTKEELYTLFSGCGDIHDIFICDDKDKSSYKYGFVRYSKAEEALKAVEELHQWPIHGTKIIVDISRDTQPRIKEEKRLNNKLLVSNRSSMQRPERRADDRYKATPLVQDIMYLSRIKETCVNLNCQVKRGLLGDDKSITLNVDRLVNKISAQKLVRIKPSTSDYGIEFTPDQIRNRLIDSDQKVGSIQSNKAVGFIKALQTVVSTMNSFLQEGNIDTETSSEESSHFTSETNAKELMICEKNCNQKSEDGETKVIADPNDDDSRNDKIALRDKDTNCRNDKMVSNDCQVSPTFKQFFFKPLSEKTSGSEVSEQTNSLLSKSHHTLIRGESFGDNSLTDSDSEEPSRDSGIECDSIFVKNLNREQDLSTSRTDSNFVSIIGHETKQIEISQEEPYILTLGAGKPTDESADACGEEMDDSDIIKAFMKNALKATEPDSQKKVESQIEETSKSSTLQSVSNIKNLVKPASLGSNTPVCQGTISSIGFGRGKLLQPCVQPVQPVQQCKEREPSLSMDNVKECEAIQNFLLNALKIKNHGDEITEIQNLTVDEVVETTRGTISVNIGRGSGRGILQMLNKK